MVVGVKTTGRPDVGNGAVVAMIVRGRTPVELATAGSQVSAVGGGCGISGEDFGAVVERLAVHIGAVHGNSAGEVTLDAHFEAVVVRSREVAASVDRAAGRIEAVTGVGVEVVVLLVGKQF